MLGKAYIKDNDIYVIFDNNNIGERTGMTYPLEYHITHFTLLNTDKLKMLGKAYIKDNDIYVIFDNNNIGERTGMTYPLEYHITHFTLLNTDKLKQEYIKLIDYTLTLKNDNNTYLKNLSKIIDDFDLYSPYLHHYTQILINIIIDEIQYLAKSNSHIKTYHLLNMSAYVYNNVSELRQGILNILDELMKEIENIKNNLINEIQK